MVKVTLKTKQYYFFNQYAKFIQADLLFVGISKLAYIYYIFLRTISIAISKIICP